MIAAPHAEDGRRDGPASRDVAHATPSSDAALRDATPSARVASYTTAEAGRPLAVALADVGAFCVLLEGVPSAGGRRVTEAVRIPTIGICAGPDTDGQVLVIQDMLGLTSGRLPRFVKPYANLRATITDAVKTDATAVADSVYPGSKHQH